MAPAPIIVANLPASASAVLQASDGRFYGTTYNADCGGTVFRVDPDGTFSVLHSFNCTDGTAARAALIEAGSGEFYGTTEKGGAHGAGTVFRISVDRSTGNVTDFRVLHDFAGGPGDGAFPVAALYLANDGNFYGTTRAGGATDAGTVFKMDATGAMTLLHSFDDLTDGAAPRASLVQADDGNLYGTASLLGPRGGGTIFRLVLTPQDTTPPELTLPGTITVEASSPSGSVVVFNATAVDAVDGPRPVTCLPASGSTFSVGTTTVNCSASDTHGNIGRGSFTVVVQDTTAPTLTLPVNLVLNSTSNAGTTVTYTASATDLVDGARPVDCSRSSGSMFPIGLTTVSCSTSDTHGNIAAGSFTVTVVDKSGPDIAFGTPVPAPNASGWNNTTVSVPFSLSDPSGIASATPSPLVFSTEGSTLTGIVTATDNVGNSLTVTSPAVKIDKTPPTVTIGTPTAGASYSIGTTLNAAYSCADALSGIGSCAGPVTNGSAIDTATAGVKTFAVNAMDNAGNPATQSVSYTVVAPDLTETVVSTPTTVAAAGSSISVTDTTANQGAANATSSTTQYYLSPNGQKSGAILLTGSRPVGSLTTSGNTSTSRSTVTVTIPTSTLPGTYYLVACANDLNQVLESNYVNNCLSSVATLQVGLPDLAETGITNPPANIVAGGSFSVTDTVKNQGGVAAGASTTRYYLSFSPSPQKIDAFVQLSGTRSVPALTSGGNTSTSKGSATVTVPASVTSGSYYLLACANDLNEVTESSYANNCISSTTTLQIAMPDLVVSVVSTPPAAVARGGSFTVTDTVKNQGTATAGPSMTGYWLIPSSSGRILLEGSRAVPSLTPGGNTSTSKGTVTVTVPMTTPLGTYSLLACADNGAVVLESNEDNNCTVAASPVTINR